MPHSAACKTGVMTNRPPHFQVYSHLLRVELESIPFGLYPESGSWQQGTSQSYHRSLGSV